MALLFRNRSLLAKRSLPSKILSRDTGYIVLIPEIGEDLPKKGSLLQSNGLPEFSNISVEKCMAAIGVQALEFEKGIKEIEKRLEQHPDPDVFIHIFQPLDILGAPLDVTWGLSKTLYLGNNTSMPTNNYLAIHEHAKRVRASKFNSKIIYDLSKRDLGDKKRTNEETRMVKKFVLEGKLNGLELDENRKYQLRENRKNLLEEIGKFKIKIETATKQFKHVINDFSIVRDFPEDLLKNMAVNSEKPNEGPWEIKLLSHIYPRFMEHCPDRNLRFNAWLASVTVGAIHRSKDLATSVHVEQIRFLRREQANILGYETYADVSMETKMAASTSNIKSLFRNLLQVAKLTQDDELNNLYKFAKERGFDGSQMELWDIPYWSRKQRKALTKYKDEEIREYFPLETVLNGLFRVCEKLFDIQIAFRQGISVWHKDVKYYDIFEKNSREPTSGFYLDLFANKNHEKPALHMDKNWMVAIQNRSKIASTMPLAALIFNYRPIGLNQPILLSFKDVETLFNKFGHALQHLLTRTTYADVAGVSNVEWDVVETSGHVFSYLLNNRSILRTVSGHYETGAVMPDDLADSMFESRKLTAGLDLCRDMYLSALDIELYTTKEYWLDVVKRLWPEFRSFPLDKLDSHPCSFSQIFSEDWAASYYSHLWSRVIAADIYSAFYEVRNDEEQIRTIGKRFRDTYLALGGSYSPNEVFRMFRGRDPSHKALLRLLGIKKDGQVLVK
ncbi:probable cytosolic oligopeptidase A [Agrilus planipennis]|uniref:Probable cytosolic oligopeptidase A n=1 Tax=Agrilus planipennis TaxID=224129 RepID=A0A1W4WMZ0_AGRPL|nr:probable cytosolic oligopeptidase A [Agrilus planipennis]